MNYQTTSKNEKKGYTSSYLRGGNSSQRLFKNQIASASTDEKDSWLDTKSAAKYLALTPNALRILVHRRQIEFFKLGSRLRFTLQALNNALIKQGD